MKHAKNLARVITAALLVPLFSMCTKAPLQIEKPVVDVKATKPVTNTDTVTKPVTPPTGSGTTISAADTMAAPRIVHALDNFTYTVQPTQWFVDGSNIPPGAIVYIPGGTRGALLLKNFQGTDANPIIIMNKGGKVTFFTAITASYAFKTQNCSNIKILGNGDPGVKYGFEMFGGNIGVTMDDLSTDFEIANLEVHDCGFAGIMAKTDPDCDAATWRGNFSMDNVLIHHNYIHNTGGEGIYIGNSFYEDGVSRACGTLMPHDVKNLKVYKNVVYQTGCEGIQVGAATVGCKVYYNTVKSPGLSPFASGQNNGIQIGEGTGGLCYNNLVKDAPGNGIIVLGLGDNTVFNNYIIKPGAHGIFADSRYTPGPYFRFINNTIIEPGQDGIKLNSETIPMNLVINNVIIKPGSGLAIHRMSNDVKLTASNNYVSNDVNSCQFVNYAGGDYHLQATSPLIDGGLNIYSYGIGFDFFGAARSAAQPIDMGAAQAQ